MLCSNIANIAIFGFKASVVCPFNPSSVPGYAFNLNITSQQSHADTAMEVESCLNPRINVEMTNDPEPSRQEASSSNQALNLPQESVADVTLPRISAGNPTKLLNAVSFIPRYQKTTSKRRKQRAELLTSSDNINKSRAKCYPTVASNHNAQKNRRLMKSKSKKAVTRPISSDNLYLKVLFHCWMIPVTKILMSQINVQDVERSTFSQNRHMIE